MTVNLSKEIIESILDDWRIREYDDLVCPECEHIEDEQYTCTTCWNYDLKVENLITAFYNKKYKNEELEINWSEILENNGYLEKFYIEELDEYFCINEIINFLNEENNE